LDTTVDPFEAQHGPILDELVAFTGEPRADIRAKMEETVFRTARLFNERDATPEQFYQDTDAYLYELASYEKDAWRAALAQLLGKSLRGRHVLEYGCGIGSFAFMLVEEGFRVTASDISERNMNFLKFRIAHRGWGDRINAVAPADALRPSRRYDIITCQHVLEHVEDPVAVLKQFLHCLRPGGLFSGIAPFDLIGPIFPEHLPENAHLRLETLCEEAGFEVQNTLPFGNLIGIDIYSVQATKPA
jgi:SAM-dependent methyltransferase